MKNRLKQALWVAMNYWSYLTGFPALASFNQTIAMFGLHGLGYDNRYHDDRTGERWFMKQVLPQIGSAACIDIGANVGKYSAALARFVPGQIIAIEPLSSTFVALQAGAGERVYPFRYAINDHDGPVQIVSQRGERASDASLHAAATSEHSITETAPGLTLDSFLAKHPVPDIGFVKIDTEGNEREVLFGMQRLIKERPPLFIQFEFNFGHLKRDHTLSALARLLPGYEFYRLLPHGMIKIEPGKYIDNLFMYCNIIARRIS